MYVLHLLFLVANDILVMYTHVHLPTSAHFQSVMFHPLAPVGLMVDTPYGSQDKVAEKAIAECHDTRAGNERMKVGAIGIFK